MFQNEKLAVIRQVLLDRFLHKRFIYSVPIQIRPFMNIAIWMSLI